LIRLGSACRIDRSRYFVRERPVPWRDVGCHLISLMLSLALVHGMIASPLLVNCLPSDGRSLVELVGHDPCHHAAGLTDGDRDRRGARNDLAPGDPADPCVDLILDNVGTSQPGAVLQSRMASGTGLPADVAPAPLLVRHLANIAVPCKLARDSLICCLRDPHIFSTLRI
jgi:hypothetical protein